MFENDLCIGYRGTLSSFSVTKEAAYVHALSLAAIAHSVAKVCALGDATSCSCEGELLDLPQRGSNTVYEMGCSDNVPFGVEFAKQFLQRRYLGIGFKENIEIHNMNVGANVSQCNCLLIILYELCMCMLTVFPQAWVCSFK